MASPALTTLKKRLREVDEVVEARDRISPTGAGRPAQRRGAAVVRAGTMLLAALFEGYVEDVYDCAVDLVYAAYSKSERTNLKNDTSGQMHNASPFKVNRLFFNLGIPWVMSSASLRWQKYPNDKVQKMLQSLVTARNKIAHGKTHTVRRETLVSWRAQIERLAERLDVVVADYVEAQTGNRPW